MKNSMLLKISLLISIIGIFTLLLLLNFQQIKTINIKDINQNLLNKKIQIQGQITNIQSYDSFQILTIKDSTGKINIILNQKTSLTKNQPITVTGRLNEYKGNLQIQAEKIIKN